MTQLFNLDHNSNNWTEYSSGAPAGDRLSLSSSAGLNGSAYGVVVTPSGATASTASDSLTGTTVNGSFEFTFYMDLNTFAISTSSGEAQAYELKDNSFGNLIRFRLKENSGDIDLSVIMKIASGDETLAVVVPQSGEFKVLIQHIIASGSSVSDGIIRIYINDVLKASNTAVDNHSYLNSLALDEFEFSPTAISGASMSGSFYMDDFVFDADVQLTYDLVVSQNSIVPMAASSSGSFLFYALEEDATSNQVIVRETRPDQNGTSLSPGAVYSPGGGTSGNVAMTSDPLKMVFHGNFGTDVGVISHAIETLANTDISPTTIGSDKIQPLEVDPVDTDHIVAVNSDDQDALETDDNGSTWSTLNATLGQTVEAMDIAFFGAFLPFSAFFGGDDATDTNLQYTPNEFSNLREDTSASLQSANAITGIAIVVDYGN